MRSSALRRTLFPTAVEVYHLHTSFPTPVGDEDAPSQDEEVVAADLPYVINPSAPLTARDEGDQCFIDMAALSVVWPDIDAVSYEAVSIGGLLHSTLYHVYFVDSDRDGTRDSCVFVTLTRIEIYEDVGTVYVEALRLPRRAARPLKVEAAAATRHPTRNRLTLIWKPRHTGEAKGLSKW